MEQQNIYDNEEFFNSYQEMRQSTTVPNANDLIEIPQLFELIGDVKGKTILDLGCGSGGHDRKLIELGAKSVLGIDLSHNMINEAIKNNNSDKIEYKVMSMCDIDKLDRKFDLVVSSLAIHYIEDYDGLCKKVYDILNPGGEFIFSNSHPNDTAPILTNLEHRWVMLNDKKYFLLSDYNNEGKRSNFWYIDGVENYHRNMSTLVNGLLKANFRLEKMQESYASEEAIRLRPKYIEQKDHSYYVYFKAKKDN